MASLVADAAAVEFGGMCFFIVFYVIVTSI